MLRLKYDFGIYRAVFAMLGIIILSATIHEAWRGYYDRPFDPATDGFLVTMWHCFSGLKNGKMILSTTTSPSDISCLHGIRFLSTTWIIILHTHSSSMRRPSYNMPALNKVYKFIKYYKYNTNKYHCILL